MKSMTRKDLMLLAAAVVMILMIPAMLAAVGVRTPGIEAAYAGGDVDLSVVKIGGMSPDGKIFSGETISVSANDLGSAYYVSGDEILSMVNNGDLTVYFSAAVFNDTDTGFVNPTSGWKTLDTQLAGTKFTCKIPSEYFPQDGEMIGIQLRTSGSDSHYNNNSKTYAIKDRFPVKARLDGSNTTYSTTLNSAEFHVTLSSLGEYYAAPDSTDTNTAYDTVVKFYRGSTKLTQVDLYGLNPQYITVPLQTGENNLTIAVYSKVNGEEYFQEAWEIKIKTASLGKNTVYATKISANKAIVRWSGVSGATGYYVYQGSKKVKTVSGTTYKVTISRKGAGKAKFKVIPFVGSSKGTSSAMKPKANVLSRSISTNYKSYDYGKGQCVVKKISGSGKKYTLTCYAINNRMFKLKKYKKINIKVYSDGKLIINKTVKNKKVNVKKYGSKKFTIKAKGKEGDLRYGSVSVSVTYSPYWGKGITSF